jgi:uncharacterized protein YraI
MKKLITLFVLFIALAALPGVAQTLAYTSKDAHLRAGPARDYPVIAILPAGTEVAVHGCLGDYSWCDVIAGPNRGWVYAGNINHPYQGMEVPVLRYGAEIGIAVVGFVLFDYWFGHYHDRPFYRDRDWWLHRPRPPRDALPPIVVRLEPPKRLDPPRRDEPRTRHPEPPRPGGSDRPRPQPPQPGTPGGESHAHPPQPGHPIAPRPTPPPTGSPSGPQPQPPQPDGPQRQLPQPPPPGKPRA